MSRTRDAGTPAQPMDMIKDDSWNVGTRLTGNDSFGELDARIGFISADHLMDNFSHAPSLAWTSETPPPDSSPQARATT